MLENPLFTRLDATMQAILSITSGGKDPGAKRLREGVFQIEHFSFDALISKRGGNLHDEDDWSSYPDLPSDKYCYGVCDGLEQFLEALGDTLASDPVRAFCVSMTQLKKCDMSPEGGWRWHKWGPYIGKQKPQMEYLYDEPLIEEVWVYHVFEKKAGR